MPTLAEQFATHAAAMTFNVDHGAVAVSIKVTRDAAAADVVCRWQQGIADRVIDVQGAHTDEVGVLIVPWATPLNEQESTATIDGETWHVRRLIQAGKNISRHYLMQRVQRTGNVRHVPLPRG